MYVADLEPAATAGAPPPIPAFVRSDSELRVSLARAGARTAPLGMREAGALRLRFPRVGGACEGIIVNTSGGIAGGDRQKLAFDLGPGAAAAITTQSAEKVYGSEGELATIATRLDVAADAHFAWLPQETILFDRSRLERHLDVQLDPSATLTIKEATVFGRIARAERISDGRFRDRWRVRRGGALILAEDVLLDGPISDLMQRNALGASATAVATIVHVAPDAEQKLAMVRDAVASTNCQGGVSAWNGMLVTRLVDVAPDLVRAACASVLRALLPSVSPRIWNC